MAPHFACVMDAIPVSLRAAHQELTRRLLTVADGGIRELGDGFEFGFPASEFESVAKFVDHERLCCPFVRFELDLAPDGGPLLLRLTGAAGIKGFLKAELRLPDRI